MAADSNGAAISLTQMSRSNPNFPELPEEWAGTRTNAGWSWFEPRGEGGGDLRRFQAATRPTLMAAVGVLVEYEDGARRPVQFLFSWDSARQTWALERLIHVGFMDDPFRSLEY